MAITSTTSTRMGSTSTVTVTTDLTGLVYFHWYIDGEYVGMSQSSTGSSSRTFAVDPDGQLYLEVQDTTDAAYDPIDNAPAGYPARRTLEWIRSFPLAANPIAHYRIEQSKNANPYTTLALVAHDERKWSYRFVVTGLTDLAYYQFRIVPVGANGNDGDALVLSREQMVRHPDAPNFSATFNAGARTVTIGAA